MGATGTTRRPRRSSAEMRQLILAAASRLFEAQGYSATTTQQIVDAAGVDPPSLYRHFDSKADLFEVAMLGPLQQFLQSHADYWSAHPLGEVDPAETMRRFATGFFTMLQENRDAMRLLVTASGDDELGKIARRVSAQFTDGLVAMRDILVAEGKVHEFKGLAAPDATIAAAVGMIMSIALFDDWVFPAGRRPSRSRVIAEIVDMVLYGVTARPS